MYIPRYFFSFQHVPNKTHVSISSYSPPYPWNIHLKLMTQTGIWNCGKMHFEYHFDSSKSWNLCKNSKSLLYIIQWWRKPSFGFLKFLFIWWKQLFEVSECYLDLSNFHLYFLTQIWIMNKRINYKIVII